MIKCLYGAGIKHTLNAYLSDIVLRVFLYQPIQHHDCKRPCCSLHCLLITSRIKSKLLTALKAPHGLIPPFLSNLTPTSTITVLAPMPQPYWPSFFSSNKPTFWNRGHLALPCFPAWRAPHQVFQRLNLLIGQVSGKVPTSSAPFHDHLSNVDPSHSHYFIIRFNFFK